MYTLRQDNGKLLLVPTEADRPKRARDDAPRLRPVAFQEPGTWSFRRFMKLYGAHVNEIVQGMARDVCAHTCTPRGESVAWDTDGLLLALCEFVYRTSACRFRDVYFRK